MILGFSSTFQNCRRFAVAIRIGPIVAHMSGGVVARFGNETPRALRASESLEHRPGDEIPHRERMLAMEHGNHLLTMIIAVLFSLLAGFILTPALGMM
jgi:hypothetical protein